MLRNILWSKIDDPQVRWLVEQILNSGSGAQPRPVTECIPFPGFVVYPEHRRLKQRKGVHYQRRFRRVAARYAAGQIELDHLTASVRGWTNHARYGNTVGLRKAVLSRFVIQSPYN